VSSDADAGSRGLRAKQELAAVALARGATAEEAAQQAGCSLRSVRRWNAEDGAFRRRVAAMRREVTERALGLLCEGMTASAAVLRSLALNARSESVKLGAARAVVELGVKLRESDELAERVALLEEDQQQRQAWHGFASHGGNGRCT
jgi:hypothetical protein